MFAVAFYDVKTQTLVCAVDHCGIKPLYYYWSPRIQDFAFASELKGIRKLLENSVDLTVDYTACYDFLTYRYVPYPAAEELRDYVSHSVQQQLIADVPVGCFLSGGIDSSVVVCEAQKYHSRIKTFTIGFEGLERDERKYARILARWCDVDYQEKTFEETHVVNGIQQLVQWYDEPFFDSSAFATYLVSALARDQVIVCLSGDGGDELFGGYTWYSKTWKYRLSFLVSLLGNHWNRTMQDGRRW